MGGALAGAAILAARALCSQPPITEVAVEDKVVRTAVGVESLDKSEDYSLESSEVIS